MTDLLFVAMVTVIVQLVTIVNAIIHVAVFNALTRRYANKNRGVCCCGADMETHPVWDNHSALDQADYYLSTTLLKYEL